MVVVDRSRSEEEQRERARGNGHSRLPASAVARGDAGRASCDGRNRPSRGGGERASGHTRSQSSPQSQSLDGGKVFPDEQSQARGSDRQNIYYINVGLFRRASLRPCRQPRQLRCLPFAPSLAPPPPLLPDSALLSPCLSTPERSRRIFAPLSPPPRRAFWPRTHTPLPRLHRICLLHSSLALGSLRPSPH